MVREKIREERESEVVELATEVTGDYGLCMKICLFCFLDSTARSWVAFVASLARKRSSPTQA